MGVASYLRSLVLVTVFAALVLVVSMVVVRTGVRGQTGEGEPAVSEVPPPNASDAPEIPARFGRAMEGEIHHLTPIPTVEDSENSEVRQVQGGIPIPPAPTRQSDGPGLPPAPKPPVGTDYEDPSPERQADPTLADTTTERDSIAIDADFAQEWTEDRDKIAILRGRCRVVQGNTTLFGQKMVIWQRADASQSIKRERLIIYVEGDGVLNRPGQSLSEQTMFLNLVTQNGVTVNSARRLKGKPATEDGLFRRAKARMDAASREVLDPTQLVVPNDGSGELKSLQIPSSGGGFRRVRIFPRYGEPFNVLSFPPQNTTPPEQVTSLTGGINMLIDGLEEYGTVDFSADRVVVWTRQNNKGELQPETVQSRDTPFQVYLEGNVVIRQGLNVVRANRAVYDAREDRALLHDAELRQFIPKLQGDVRVRAERMRQLNRDTYFAQHAWATASKFGKPGYRIQSSELFIEKRLSNPWSLFGGPPQETSWLTSKNNTFFIGNVPLLYSPYLSAPAQDPNIPLKQVYFSQDRIFGTKLGAAWDMFQLLGWENPPNGTWNLLTDYRSYRGPGLGSRAIYSGTNFLGVDGRYFGNSLVYGIHDSGLDNLGLNRRTLVPKTRNRGRISARHRQQLSDTLDITGELGWISDRNFLESYYEKEFDNQKDQETLLYLRNLGENTAWTGLFRPQVNSFENTTEWLPRGDFYMLSKPLLNGALTWSNHTSGGYGMLKRGDLPYDPAQDLDTPIPYIVNRQGAVLMTRHEIDAPLSMGPFQISPYALGDASYWSQDLNGNPLGRLVGSTGIRSSLYAWRAFPYVQSRLFNVNGLAHKMVFETEYSYTNSSTSLSNVAQYNEINDNSQERFQQRFPFNTYGILAAGRGGTAIRSPVLCNPHRDGAKRNRPLQRTPRRPTGGSLGVAASAANQSRPAGEAANQGLDDLRFVRPVFSPSQPRQLRRKHRFAERQL